MQAEYALYLLDNLITIQALYAKKHLCVKSEKFKIPFELF
jgi:hypothetical protein